MTGIFIVILEWGRMDEYGLAATCQFVYVPCGRDRSSHPTPSNCFRGPWAPDQLEKFKISFHEMNGGAMMCRSKCAGHDKGLRLEVLCVLCQI